MKNGIVVGAAGGNMVTLADSGAFTLPWPLHVHQRESNGRRMVYLGHVLIHNASKPNPGKWGAAYSPDAVSLRHLLADALAVCGHLYRNADYFGEEIAQGARDAELAIVGHLTSPEEAP